MINLAEISTKVACREPSAVAVIEPHLGISRTFGQLARRTELMAHLLQDRLAAGNGCRVVVYSRNSVECMELYLACAAVGAILFPLNWRQSSALNLLAIQDAEAAVVFYDSEFASEVAQIKSSLPAMVWIEWTPGGDSEFEELLRREEAEQSSWRPLPSPESLLHQPFIAVSTGGTTGIAKSAVHSQYTYGASMINYLAAQRINETDVFMMLGQFFHVTGYMPLAHLAMGRPVVITNFDADVTIDIIRQESVTTFFCIATMLPRLVSSLLSSGLQTPSVRLVGYGGAPMGEAVIGNAAKLMGTDLVQIWGMTELGTGTVLGPKAHRQALSGERPELLQSCGKAALLSTVSVLDESGNPVPQDGKSAGELCHRGASTMLYYWKKDDETNELIRDGWIHSGDGATWDAEGNIFIVDRLKNMIISGGENIFPAEIEKIIANMDGVAEVAVVGSQHDDWGEVVRAVIARQPGSSLGRAEVIARVEAELGSYRKPRIVDFVDELPMTPTGKVNLKVVRALPLTDQAS